MAFRHILLLASEIFTMYFQVVLHAAKFKSGVKIFDLRY